MSRAAPGPVPSLIEALKRSIPMEVRESTDAVNYLEGVLSRDDLGRCEQLLGETFGTPAKPFDQPATIEPQIQQMVDRFGGIWPGQCLFLKVVEPDRFAYAALWPWESDPQRVTLKVGTLDREPGGAT